MNNDNKRTASPDTDDRYDSLVNELDKVESANEYTGISVTPLMDLGNALFELEKDKERRKSRERQK